MAEKTTVTGKEKLKPRFMVWVFTRLFGQVEEAPALKTSACLAAGEFRGGSFFFLVFFFFKKKMVLFAGKSWSFHLEVGKQLLHLDGAVPLKFFLFLFECPFIFSVFSD